jgi:small subunit ribosomal protein S5
LGNGRGSAGFAFGKGATLKNAMEDATMKAYRDIVSIPLYENRTLHHDVVGRYNNVKVTMRSARPGYGLKAGPILNAICDCFGIRDCVTRVRGSTNRYTVVHAAFKSFTNYRSVEEAALTRGQRLIDVNGLLEDHYANEVYNNWGKGQEGVQQHRQRKKNMPQFKMK